MDTSLTLYARQENNAGLPLISADLELLNKYEAKSRIQLAIGKGNMNAALQVFSSLINSSKDTSKS